MLRNSVSKADELVDEKQLDLALERFGAKRRETVNSSATPIIGSI